ncbi:rho GTPase-activating protein 6 isoform X3 [Oncorhynchus tshawytscha]|uniref:rho GTPase-activating protein 6 isoform X3 n=1 Tax=Oncorhynchus tshawytscha TaxID=74940 RepID=UPI001C3E3C6B|nr:rho GTPase-activating protein 6 isoform X3 [Oncorhynchus tshawytscha]
MSSGQGILNVFSCSTPASKAISKRKLRQTRSLDPDIIRKCGTETDGTRGDRLCLPGLRVEDAGAFSSSPSSPEHQVALKSDPRSRNLSVKQPLSSLSGPSTPLDISPTSNFPFDYDVTVRGTKRNTAWDLPFLVRSPSVTPTGSTNTLFSPRRWLQKKQQQSSSHAYIVWKSEGDFTWNSLSGRSVRLTPTAIQSLSELERTWLQEVAFNRLHQDYDLGCQITIPKECIPQAFGMALSQVIANDRTHRQRQDGLRQDPPHREEHKDPSDLVSSILQFATKRSTNKELSSSNSSLSSTSETANESTSPNTPEAAPRARRRGGMSVDSITDLDNNQSRLLEALQLSLPAEAPSKKEKHRDKRLSLNPIYRQVPRLVDSCCQHLEKYGLQTVGIFRVGSSKKRVRQVRTWERHFLILLTRCCTTLLFQLTLREEFDRGVDVQLDEEHSVHDVAALLKEFLRDMPDPLLTKELYTAFINTMLLDCEEQWSATQLLVYLLPACNSDTLHRLLQFLSTVANHAHDSQDKDGQEVTGNKMTSLNLATIFGPNLLHKQKSSDKEFSVQSSARAEESTAVIAVLQRMITTFHSLFMVPPDLQNEVLMTLLETDPDVVDYLLRRKASQSPDVLRSEDPFSLSERRSSSDSNKVSSGELSPYDNNSPILSEHPGEGNSPGSERLFHVPEQYTLVSQVAGRTRDTHGSNPWVSKEEHANIWGAWHSTLKPGLKDQPYAGSHSNMSEGSSRSSQEGLDCLQGDARQVVRQTQTSLGVAECRPHPPVTRVCSSPHGEAGRPLLLLSLNPLTPPHPHLDSQSAASSAEDLPQGIRHQAIPSPNSGHSGPALSGRPPPPPYSGSSSRLSPAASKPAQPVSHSPAAPLHQHPLQGGGPTVPQNSASPTTYSMVPMSQEWQDWQRDRWQIWQLLSSENADTLPETLV